MGGLFGGVRRQFTGGLFALGGGGAVTTLSGFVPLPDDGVTGVAKTALVAAAVGYAAKRFLSAETAYAVSVGAAEAVWRKLATLALGETAVKFGIGHYETLQAYALPPGVGDYMGPGTMYENGGIGEYQEYYQ